MTGNEVLALARSGELLQLSPVIKNDNEVLVGFLNLALTELYKRFQLKTDEAIITLRELKTIYSLDGTDPDVVMGAPYMYLLGAYGSKGEDRYSLEDLVLPINSEDNLYSINTISYNQVQIPAVIQDAVISLIYVAKPTKVTVATLDKELDVPDQFVEAILHYIGYRAHGAMDGNIQAESNTHYLRFEKACDKLRELGVGVTPDDLEMSGRILSRGFV